MKLRSTLLVAGLIAVAGSLFYFGLGAAVDPCRNEMINSLAAPGGDFKAVAFERDCGATTGFSTQVSILRAGQELPHESGNIFVADRDHGLAPAGSGGGPKVTLVWRDSNHLEVRCHPKARVFFSVASFEGIAITYVRSSAP